MSDDRRILDRLIPGTEWHPLTNGGAPPDYIPPVWDGPHVGKRLVEALLTLPAAADEQRSPRLRQQLADVFPRLGGSARPAGDGKRPARAARARAEPDTIVVVLDRRIARLGFMAGRGLSLTSIMADDTIAARSERAVRVAASRWHLPIGAAGLLPVALSLDDRRRLDDAARARGTTSAELALALLRVVVQQDLIKAVIDDSDH